VARRDQAVELSIDPLFFVELVLMGTVTGFLASVAA
jgi:hypothetical protein